MTSIEALSQLRVARGTLLCVGQCLREGLALAAEGEIGARGADAETASNLVECVVDALTLADRGKRVIEAAAAGIGNLFLRAGLPIELPRSAGKQRPRRRKALLERGARPPRRAGGAAAPVIPLHLAGGLGAGRCLARVGGRGP